MTSELAKTEYGVNLPVVYVMSSGGLVKIGQTTNLNRRIRMFRSHSAIPVEIAAWASVPVGGDLMSLETATHEHFAHLRLHGEWFDVPALEVAEYLHSHPWRESTYIQVSLRAETPASAR